MSLVRLCYIYSATNAACLAHREKIDWTEETGQAEAMIRIIGSFVSPYVREVLACMNLKGLTYEVDPITPFFGDDEFTRVSPLRRIPVLIDGDFHTSDSSVICAYLDEA